MKEARVLHAFKLVNEDHMRDVAAILLPRVLKASELCCDRRASPFCRWQYQQSDC